MIKAIHGSRCLGAVLLASFSFFLSTLSAQGFAATAELVRNIDAAIVPESSYPTALGMLGGKMLFGARDAQGYSLWSTDGTAGGTAILKRNIRVIATSPGVTGFVQIGSRVYFISYLADFSGQELWGTDGTPSGTVRIEDLPGGSSNASVSIQGALGSSLVFAAADASGVRQLYITDGSPGSTRVLTAFTGTNSSPSDGFMAVGSKFYFHAHDNTYAHQLWVSDGTATGTHQLTNSLGNNSVGSSATYNPQYLHKVGNQVIYTSSNLLWRIDIPSDTIYAITAAGGSDGFGPPRFGANADFVELNGFLVFIGQGGGLSGLNLWRTDGTTSGTYSVAPIVVGNPSFEAVQSPIFRKAGDRVVYVANDGVHGNQLWGSDGTAQNTVQLTTVSATAPFQGAVPILTGSSIGYFTLPNSDGTTWSLWRTDGTVAGTRKVNGAPTIGQSEAGTVIAAGDGNQLLFTTYGDISVGIERSLFRYDVALETTTLLKSAVRNNGGDEYFYANGLLYFSNDSLVLGSEPWISDGSVAGTHLVADLNPQTMDGSSAADEFVEFNGGIAFAAEDGVDGRELWFTDGTLVGTRLLADVNPGAASSNPNHLFVADSALYFFATDALGRSHFMRLAAGSATAEVLADAAAQNPSVPSQCERDTPVTMGGKIYFAAADADFYYGIELWSSDGTPAGTHRVADIGQGFFSSYPCYLTVSGGRLFFTADDLTSGTELWISDGTEAGTHMVVDIAQGSDTSNPGSLVAFDGNVYFRAYESVHGSELWKSDGTTSGTLLAAEFTAGTSSSGAAPKGVLNGKLLLEVFRRDAPNEPYKDRLYSSDGTLAGSVQLTPDTIDQQVGTFINGGKAYFVAYDSTAGFEPWVTDGTPAGTQRLKDINAAGNSGTTWFENFRGVTLFNAVDATQGDQVWRTDGTPAGTTLVANVLPPTLPAQTAAASAHHRTTVGQKFLFVGTDPTMGAELYSIANGAPTATADSASSAEGAAVTVNVLANDTDADGTLNPAKVLVVSNPLHGTVIAGAAGALIYTPSAGFAGTDTFGYTVEDNQGATSNAATVTVTSTITPVVTTTGQRSGGGGSIDLVLLLALCALLGLRLLPSDTRSRAVARR